MSSPRHDDPLIQLLAALPPVIPVEGRAERVRARCRAQLDRPPRQIPSSLGPVTVGAVCAAYAWQIGRIVAKW